MPAGQFVAVMGATGSGKSTLQHCAAVWRRDRYLRGSDHISFLLRGCPAARFTEPRENFNHEHQNARVENGVQFGDLPEFCDFRYIARVAKVNAATLWSLAQAPSTPGLGSVGIEPHIARPGRCRRMPDYPQNNVEVNHIEPVPRRVRATLGGQVVLDTTRAVYLWEWPNYPQYYIPVKDIDADVLVDDDHVQKLSRGTARRFSLRVGEITKAGVARVYTDYALPGLSGLVRLDWDALDSWFEEDEEVFVHPRNPYARVDALRSTRRVRVEVDGVVLADSRSPVMVFETGLPTRYYLNRTEIDFTHLRPTDTETACPYKGRTTGYWSVEVGGRTYPDLAWTYDFPSRSLDPIAGLISFYNEKVDIFLDSEPVDRPVTHFSKD